MLLDVSCCDARWLLPVIFENSVARRSDGSVEHTVQRLPGASAASRVASMRSSSDCSPSRDWSFDKS